MKKLFFFFFIIMPFLSFTQKVSCVKLVNHVERNGHLMNSNQAPMFSEWLGDVKAYSMVKDNPSLYKVSDIINHYKSDGTYAVIATFKSTSKKYIFCGIPIRNWEKFNTSTYLSKSRGEMFHQFIYKYRCDCNN